MRLSTHDGAILGRATLIVALALCNSGCGTSGTEATACVTAADCPLPPDARCGYATCEDGICGLVIEPGPTRSQTRGDCKTIYCDTQGNAEEKYDGSDAYDDGWYCTLDTCDGTTPENPPYPDGLACPELNAGVCYKGTCVFTALHLPRAECIEHARPRARE